MFTLFPVHPEFVERSSFEADSALILTNFVTSCLRGKKVHEDSR